MMKMGRTQLVRSSSSLKYFVAEERRGNKGRRMSVRGGTPSEPCLVN